MKINIVNSGVAIVGTYITKLLGGWDLAIQLLIGAIVLDYVTGVIVAFKEKKLSSQIGRNGIIKKVGYLLAVIFAVMIDLLLNTNDPYARTAMIYICFANEGLSIIENLGNMGVWLPQWLKNVLVQLREKMGGEEEPVKKVE